MTYKRHDGSYSAFGENDSSGSMWLTAFVVKSFAQSEAYIYIDPLELAMTKSWIISSQLLDGSFPPVGRVLNKDIQVNRNKGISCQRRRAAVYPNGRMDEEVKRESFMAPN